MSYSKDIKETLNLFIETSENGSLELVYRNLTYGRFASYKEVVDFAKEERLRRLTYFFEENYLMDYYTKNWENTTDLNSLEVSEAMRDLLEESFSWAEQRVVWLDLPDRTFNSLYRIHFEYNLLNTSIYFKNIMSNPNNDFFIEIARYAVHFGLDIPIDITY